MRSWLALSVGLAAAAAALYVLVSGGGEPRSEIDPASREQLERVLEEADG